MNVRSTLKPSLALALLAALTACEKPSAPAADTAASAPAASIAAAAPAGKPGEYTVVIKDEGCETNALSVPAGKSTFKIVNKSARAVEWEILKGVIVVEERENIAPGFTQSLSADLQAGDYDITCGLLSNPKGKLTVTANGDQPAAAGPSLDALNQPLTDYKAYVAAEVSALVDATGKFTAAVKAGKLKEAQALYGPTRQHYERIEPIAELFSDLDKSMDARADDFKDKEKDPTFTGFHRIEYGLFAEKSTKGLNDLSDKLLADTQELKKRVDTLAFPPKKLVGGAAELIEEVAKTKISGEEDRYSHTDLFDFQANVDGAKKVYDLLRPLVDKADASLSPKIDANFKEVDDLLAKYKKGDGYVSYEKVTEADRNALKGPITALAEDLSKLRGTLGMD
ncbi:iron uptake system protein EfeO [Amantichitinum ursilacus]|uniref:Iron uptake system component EfeO n=1 Tax=Amantichitinum ursilacus TaxID=857265 RepID=A0A0N0XJ58_9NEIS|nr:iron uptake system protein EfeO [Amantichitinum ursilacus]KPC51896.1 Iron uptake system component EfeO precursor [Amantichitinum ursilacus]